MREKKRSELYAFFVLPRKPMIQNWKKLKTNPLGQKISNREIEQDNNANTCNMLERERERERESQNLKPLYLQRWRRINHWWQKSKIPPATLSQSERQSIWRVCGLGTFGLYILFCYISFNYSFWSWRCCQTKCRDTKEDGKS